MISGRFIYACDCTCVPLPLGEAIQELAAFDESSREIAGETFRRRTHWQKWARGCGYATGPAPGLLHLKDDHHTVYKVGKWRGRRAYVVMWSAYHCIFTADGAA
jgi:hypothetical protein